MDPGVELFRQVQNVPARYPCRSLIRLRTILCEARRSSTRIYSTGTVPQSAYRQWRNAKPGAKTVWAQHHSMTRVDIAWTKVRIDGFSPLRERALKGSSLDVCARYATTLVDHQSPALRCKPGFSVVRKMNGLLLPRLNAGRTSEKYPSTTHKHSGLVACGTSPNVMVFGVVNGLVSATSNVRRRILISCGA